MKKILSIFMAFLAMVLLTPNVSAEALGQMTADELLATAENKTITLDGDVTLTTNLVVDGDVEVIDLNNHTLTLKGVSNISSGMANPLVVNSELEIKNGTITRYVAPEDSSELSLIRGSIVKVSGSDANLVLNKVTLDGKNLDVTTSTDNGSYALYVINGASATLNDSKLVNNNVITGNSNWGSTLYAKEAESIILNNTEVSNNRNEDENRGGIIYITETETVEFNNSIVSNNTVVGTGGVVDINKCGSLLFDKDSIVKNNKSGEASGFHITDTNSTIAGTIEGNETTLADGNGGGLYTYLTDSTKTITITETAVIKNNKAAAGAGILVNGPDVEGQPGMVIINGGTITGNTAVGTPAEGTLRDGGGAGVYVYRGAMTINGGTIENNTSTSGVGSAIVVSHQNRNLDAGTLEINGGIIKGSIALGNGSIAITGGTYSEEPNASYIVAPYVAKNENSMYVIGVDSEDVTLDYAGITPDKEVEGELTEAEIGVADSDQENVNKVLFDSLDENKELVEGAADIEVSVEIDFVDVSENDKKLIEDSLEDGKVGVFFNVDVNVYADGDNVGKLSKLTDKIKLTVMLPEDLKEVEDGYTREYYIVTVHDGQVKTIEATLSEDGRYLTFETSEFSTYAVAYEDVVRTNPNTGDNALIYGLISFVALVGVATTVINLKRRYN